MMVHEVDPGDELRWKYTAWWVGLERAIVFELAASVTAGSETVRRQCRQDAALLWRLIWPSRN